MRRLRTVALVLAPFAVVVISVCFSWMNDKTLWYFRGYEYYSDWVYTGLAESDVVMTESGDSSREYIFDRVSSRNTISLNEFGDRETPCSSPTVVGLGDSQMFGSGLTDNETFPSYVYQLGGPCMYNAGRHSILDALRNPKVRAEKVLVTSTERDGFVWYCDTPPNDWNLSLAPPESFVLRQNFSLRVAVKVAFDRTIHVLKSKVQNAIALRINAPGERLIKYQHAFNEQDLVKNLSCLEEMSVRFKQENIDATYMLFPAAQTLYPNSAPLDVDKFTLNFISSLSTRARQLGIQIIDSRMCLIDSHEMTHQLHDTHLSAAGMKALAACYVSDL